jgi:hypothetical protein
MVIADFIIWNKKYTTTPQLVGIMAIGVDIRPSKMGMRYGIFNKNKTGTASSTYPCLGVYLANKRYSIINITTIITDNIGDIKYTCSTDINAAIRTITAEGVNALNKDNPRIIGSAFNLASYPISLFIV